MFGSAVAPTRRPGELALADDGALVLENVDAFEPRIAEEALATARAGEVVRRSAALESRSPARAWVVASAAACGCECCNPGESAGCPAPNAGARRKAVLARTFAAHPPVLAMLTPRTLPAGVNAMRSTSAVVARATPQSGAPARSPTPSTTRRFAQPRRSPPKPARC